MPGEGSVFKAKTGWTAQLTISQHPRRYRTRTGFPTRREAQAALAELRGEQAADKRPSRQSLGTFLRWWLDETVRPSISANTYRGYDDVLTHLQPLSAVPLRDLKPEHLESVFNRMTVKRGEGPASPKTVRNAQLMLRAALASAEQRGYVTRNVARMVPLRRVPRRGINPLSPDDARAILEAVAGDRYEAAFAVALIGLRASEILGLAWSDLDLERGMVSVRYQLVGSGSTAHRAQLKTAASAATVPMPTFVVDRLLAHRERQRAERPIVPIADSLVFTTPNGWAVNGSWLTKHFQRLLAKAGLPRMRLHDLRHGAASLLMGAGAHPRVAQELLRHATSRTTMEIYTHVSALQQREAAHLLDLAISPSVSHAVVGESGGE